MRLVITDRELLFGIPSLAQQHNNNGDQRQTPNQSFHTLSKGHDHTAGESTDIVNKGIQSCTTYSLYDSDTWSITNDLTIGQSGLNVEVILYHGLGEQYFMRSMHTISVMLQCSSQHQSPSPPKLTLLAWTYHDYVLNVMDSLLFFLQLRFFWQDWLKQDFFPHMRVYFSASHADSPIMEASDIGQVSMHM